jgi:hypothetical protein
MGAAPPGSEVPYPYPVLASADYPAIWEDLDCQHSASVTGEADEAMRCCGVPHPNPLVVPAAHHPTPVTPDRERTDRTGMAA